MIKALLWVVQQYFSFLRVMRENNTSSFAAAAAFFVYLSVIPVVILICSILPYTNITQEMVSKAILGLIPVSVASFLAGVMAEFRDQSVAAISVTTIIILWTAGKGLFALVNGLNAVNHVNEGRNFVVLRIRASYYTLLMIAIMFFSLVVLVCGNYLNRFFTGLIPNFNVFLQMLLHFRFLFVWAIFTFFFQLLYTFLPSKHMVFKEQFPGALFASVGWSLFSWGFSVYLNFFNSFSIYGSLTTIIIGMIWLYFCMYILLTGAQINLYFQPLFEAIEQHRQKRKRRKKEASAERKQQKMQRRRSHQNSAARVSDD